MFKPSDPTVKKQQQVVQECISSTMLHSGKKEGRRKCK